MSLKKKDSLPNKKVTPDPTNEETHAEECSKVRKVLYSILLFAIQHVQTEFLKKLALNNLLTAARIYLITCRSFSRVLAQQK